MYEELKNKVTSKAGLDYASPSDCLKIVTDIFKVTNKKISETTLKRFFGFASVKYKLSQYTLSVLNEYTDSECTITINTKINPTEGKLKNDTEIQFDLMDGDLQSGNCIHETNPDHQETSQNEEVPITIKLTKNQVKDVIKKIKQTK
jgi:hypothetical protein